MPPARERRRRSTGEHTTTSIDARLCRIHLTRGVDAVKIKVGLPDLADDVARVAERLNLRQAIELTNRSNM